MHFNGSHVQGEMAGTDEVTLSIQQIPAHFHPLLATQHPGSVNIPASDNLLADEGPAGITQIFTYKQSSANQLTLNPAIVSMTGGSQPHNNLQRTLCVNYIISLYGVFPSQT
jgi:microcystin-dependent protein